MTWRLLFLQDAGEGDTAVDEEAEAAAQQLEPEDEADVVVVESGDEDVVRALLPWQPWRELFGQFSFSQQFLRSLIVLCRVLLRRSFIATCTSFLKRLQVAAEDQFEDVQFDEDEQMEEFVEEEDYVDEQVRAVCSNLPNGHKNRNGSGVRKDTCTSQRTISENVFAPCFCALN